MQLSGRFYRHKGSEPWLDHVQREVEGYPRDQRIFLIQDNMSTHWTPDVRGSVKEKGVTLVASATQASWMNPVESQAGNLQRLVLDGSNLSTRPEVRREFARAISFRSRERASRKKRFRDHQIGKLRIHKRPVWKRY